jgi:hypothetical protein
MKTVADTEHFRIVNASTYSLSGSSVQEAYRAACALLPATNKSRVSCQPYSAKSATICSLAHGVHDGPNSRSAPWHEPPSTPSNGLFPVPLKCVLWGPNEVVEAHQEWVHPFDAAELVLRLPA